MKKEELKTGIEDAKRTVDSETKNATEDFYNQVQVEATKMKLAADQVKKDLENKDKK